MASPVDLHLVAKLLTMAAPMDTSGWTAVAAQIVEILARLDIARIATDIGSAQEITWRAAEKLTASDPDTNTALADLARQGNDAASFYSSGIHHQISQSELANSSVVGRLWWRLTSDPSKKPTLTYPALAPAEPAKGRALQSRHRGVQGSSCIWQHPTIGTLSVPVVRELVRLVRSTPVSGFSPPVTIWTRDQAWSHIRPVMR